MNNSFKEISMKLYSHLGLLIALCTMITIHAMNPDEIIAQETALFNKHSDIVRHYTRTERYDLYASEICKRIAAGARGKALTVSPLPHNQCYQDPLLELCVDANFQDLVERLLDVMPIQYYQKDYNEALIASVLKESLNSNQLTKEQLRDFSITRLLVNRGADVNYFSDRMRSYPLFEVLDKVYSFDNIPWPHEAILPILIFLLKHNANPNLGFTQPLRAIMRKITDTCDNEFEIIRLLVCAGGCLDNKLTGLEALYALKLKLENRPLYSEALVFYNKTITEQRDALIASVQRGEDISFTKVNGISRFYVKDTDGNNLLFHALQNKNIKVAARLLCFRPELLSQRNFKDESVWNDATVLQNFVSMICSRDGQ
jgi:hypothetical protein